MSARAGVRRTSVVLACLAGANAPWVVAGLTSPAATTSDPVGALVFGTGDEGLPVGVQVMAPALGEELMLRAAAVLEAAAP